MRGYDENRVWVDEPITEAQRAVVTALGFPAPEAWKPTPWSCGAFAGEGAEPDTVVIVRHLPYLPEVNAVLKAAGFRWDAGRKEWCGTDRTRAQVEALQALDYCAGRLYPDGSRRCPVRVGAYERV